MSDEENHQSLSIEEKVKKIVADQKDITIRDIRKALLEQGATNEEAQSVTSALLVKIMEDSASPKETAKPSRRSSRGAAEVSRSRIKESLENTNDVENDDDDDDDDQMDVDSVEDEGDDVTDDKYPQKIL